MASWVERGTSGIIYKAAETWKVPDVDVLTLLFDSELCGAKEDTLLHIDADDTSKSVNKADLRSLTKLTAHTLRHQFGIGQDGTGQDVVLAISTGHWMLPALFYSTIAAGGIFSASSPASTPSELAGQHKQVRAKLLVCCSLTKPVALATAKILNLPSSRVLVLDDGPSFALREATTDKSVALSSKSLDWERVTDVATLESRTICVLFSSGTTGLPKGVCLSHRNIVAEAVLVIDPAREHSAVHNPEFAFRTLAHLPPAHIAGIQGYFINPFYYGGPVYWMRRFDFVRFLEHNRRLRITIFFSVPPIYLLIAKSPLVTDQFDTLDYALSGAAPMGKELQEAAERKMGRGKCVLSQTWGLSETTGSITALPRGLRDDTGSVSMLVANSEARIVDDNGKDVEPGARGEIWVRGPVVTKGYWDNDQANKEAFVDGWFCTGDVGYFKNGMFYIVDRKKELIKYKGNQVAPAELEGLLLTHPKIQDAAVIGIEREDSEVPRAYVVADQKQITAKGIMAWVKERVASHKQLRGGVVFVEVVPKSPSGKILRKVLREMEQKERRAKL